MLKKCSPFFLLLVLGLRAADSPRIELDHHSATSTTSSWYSSESDTNSDCSSDGHVGKRSIKYQLISEALLDEVCFVEGGSPRFRELYAQEKQNLGNDLVGLFGLSIYKSQKIFAHIHIPKPKEEHTLLTTQSLLALLGEYSAIISTQQGQIHTLFSLIKGAYQSDKCLEEMVKRSQSDKQ